jgi:hypothetical protein
VAGGAGGTVLEITRPVLELVPVALSRRPVVLERGGLTEPVMGELRWVAVKRPSTPASEGNRLPMSWAN